MQSSDVGAILRDSAQLLLPLTSPCCDHKTPSSPQGSVQRSPRNPLSWLKLLLWILGSVGMGMCEDPGLKPWQPASSAHNCSHIHNLIMTFTLIDLATELDRSSMQMEQRSTHTPCPIGRWVFDLSPWGVPRHHLRGVASCYVTGGALKSRWWCRPVCHSLIFLQPHTNTLLVFGFFF